MDYTRKCAYYAGMAQNVRTNNASRVGLLDPARVVARRVDLGLLQKEVAQRAGISAQFLADIENGRRHGSPPTRLAIAKALRTPLRELVRQEVTA